MSDNGDETHDADPELLAALKRRAEASQAASETRPSDGVDTDEADPELLSRIRANAAQRQVELDSANTTAAPATDELGDRESATRYGPKRDASLGSPTDAPATQQHSDPDPSGSDSRIVATGTDASVTKQVNAQRQRPNRAAAFVREAQSADPVNSDDPSPAPKQSRRSGLLVIMAVFLGAQILAVGAFITLRSLQSDDDTVEEIVQDTSGSETLDVLASTALPDAVTAAPLAATPTAVPPTPDWRPINQGPRTNPFRFTVEAIVNAPTVYDSRSGSPVLADSNGQPLSVDNPRASGEPLILQVALGTPGDEWAEVLVPGSKDPLWIDSNEFTWRSTNTAIQVDIAANIVRIFDGNEVLHVGVVASGRLERPTEQLLTWAVEQPSAEGSDAILLLADGDEQDATSIISLADGLIEGDGYITDGRILVLHDTAEAIREHIVAGSNVEFVGTPPRPTPTPIPTPTLGPASDLVSPRGSVGSPGCPAGGQGSPPNCYQVVPRTSIKGSCESYQVEIDDACMLFGGDPNSFDPNNPGCPAAAPENIGNRCFTRIGPVPEILGNCPEGAGDIAGECRIAL